MSLIGPRPELPAIVATYQPWQHARHSVKPGLTGLWQVTERGNGLMHQHTDIDLRYAHHVTLKTDLHILTQTIPTLLGRRNPGD
jgi:lipopolysaccharide/colanic/teichoic acid biosynthesis glycosyltransferase